MVCEAGPANVVLGTAVYDSEDTTRSVYQSDFLHHRLHHSREMFVCSLSSTHQTVDNAQENCNHLDQHLHIDTRYSDLFVQYKLHRMEVLPRKK